MSGQREQRGQFSLKLLAALLAVTTLVSSPAGAGGATAPASVQESADDNQARATVVRELVAAFNAHNPQAMGALMVDEIEWLSVAGSSIAIEAEGQAALIEGMTAYFADFPTVRSRIEKLAVVGRYVVVEERVTWSSGDGERSQASMAVWEVIDGKVVRVWYYPAEQDDGGRLEGEGN